jgi:hypothetical protein
MKRTLIILILLVWAISVRAQENWISVSGGYAFADLEETDVKTTGWRISAAYEKNAYEGKMANGVVVGYIATEASVSSGVGQLTDEYKLNTWPIYYMPKYLFGGDSFKGFVKGAVGLHISNYTKTTTLLIVEDEGVGFYGGVGAGAMFTINKLFISAEYEWAFASNSNYRNGFMNSAMLGIGIKF